MAIEGLSNYPDEPLGTQWRSVFIGDLTNEFIVVGRWTWTRQVSGMPATTGDNFALTMPIAFDDQYEPVIQIVRLDVGAADPADPGPVHSLERISSSTAHPD